MILKELLLRFYSLLYFTKDKFFEIINDKNAQSMAEYSLIMAGLMGLFLTAGFDLFPRFVRAFQLYFDSYYIMLNLPIP